MHRGTCVTYVSWWMSGSLTRGGGENIPGIPSACATRSFAYLARGSCSHWQYCSIGSDNGLGPARRPMVVSLLMHTSATLPQWVKAWIHPSVYVDAITYLYQNPIAEPVDICSWKTHQVTFIGVLMTCEIITKPRSSKYIEAGTKWSTLWWIRV